MALTRPPTLRDVRRILTPRVGELRTITRVLERSIRVAVYGPPVERPRGAGGSWLGNRPEIRSYRIQWAYWQSPAIDLGLEQAKIIRELDRLISVQGASAPFLVNTPESGAAPRTKDPWADEDEDPPWMRRAGEEREKNTDEVAPQGETPSDDATKHGGDGNSGEVDHAAETSSEAPREGQDGGGDPSCDSNGSGSPLTVGSGTSASAEDQNSPIGSPSAHPEGSTGVQGGERGESREPTPSQGEADSDRPDGADIPECDAPDSARAPGNADADETTAAGPAGNGPKPDGDAESPTGTSIHEDDGESPTDDAEGVEDGQDEVRVQPRRCSGGQYANYTKDWKGRVDQRDVASVKRSLEKVLRTLDVGVKGDPSPRIHGGRLVRELTSRRCSLSRARREEQEPALRVIMCDVSGSCAAAAPETVAAAQAIAESDPTVVVVLHSNGFTIDALGLPLRNDMQYGSTEAITRDWDEVLRSRKIAGVVWFGDDDGSWLPQHWSGRWPDLQVIWLDSFSSTKGVRPAARGAVGKLGFQVQTWWWGVNNAKTAAIALRAICRERRSR